MQSEITWPEAVTTGIFVKLVVFLTVNHRGPLPLRELHSTGETIVWRDPGGSWACLPPAYDYQRNHHATVPDTCGLHPEKAHYEESSPRKWHKDQNHKESWAEEGVRKRPKRKHSEWKEPPKNAKHSKITNNNSWVEEDPRRNKTKTRERKHSNWKAAIKKSEKNSPIKC